MGARFVISGFVLAPLVGLSLAWGQSDPKAAETAISEQCDRVFQSAERGNADAQFTLGDGYLLGSPACGISGDYTQAALWFRKAAEQGNAAAQYDLALLYNTGQGVPQDYAEGYFWAELAASRKVNGVKPEIVAKLRDESASFLTKEVLLKIQERARKWFEAHQPKPE